MAMVRMFEGVSTTRQSESIRKLFIEFRYMLLERH
jgi:hypothetical protein